MFGNTFFIFDYYAQYHLSISQVDIEHSHFKNVGENERSPFPDFFNICDIYCDTHRYIFDIYLETPPLYLIMVFKQ